MKSVIYFHHQIWCGDICQGKTSATPCMNIDAPPPDLLRIDALLWTRSRGDWFSFASTSVTSVSACGDQCPPRMENRRVQQRVLFLSPPLCLPSHYSAAVLLEDSEGQRRLNSSVEYSLETNQEEPQNNNPCPPSLIHCYFVPDFSLAFDSLRKS